MATSSSLSKAQYASVFSAVLGVGSLVAPLFVDASVVYLAVGGLSVLCSILAMTFIWKAHFSVGRIVETANAVSKGDFEARTICLGEGGDLGQLSNAVNELIDRTDAYVRETAAAMSYVADNRYNRKIVEKGMVGAFLRGATIINRAIEQTDHKVQAFRKVADNFEATMGEVARALASASGGLGDSATSIDAEARDTGSQAQIATSSTHEAAESVERVAAATEELSASVNAIREQVSRSAAVTAEISNAVGETHGTMEELKGAAERIGRFITLIADLASQTNLLALNATIEAARAGEFGKGFAVVAAEVKMLADTTAKATDDIRREVEGIQASTQDAVGKFTRIAETMAHVEESSGAIAASIEEQAVATNEIASSVAIVSGGMRQVSGTVDRVSQAAEATQMAVEAVKAAADEIASRSTRLTGEVDTFLGQVRAVA